jgi:hypothetical protein
VFPDDLDAAAVAVAGLSIGTHAGTHDGLALRAEVEPE